MRNKTPDARNERELEMRKTNWCGSGLGNY